MLEAGDVFLIRDPRNTGYDPHYQIVVHKTASNDLVLVYATTKIDKAKERCIRDSPDTPTGEVPKTYVEIPKGSCASLPRLSAVDCNKAFLSNESERESGMDFKKRSHKIGKEFLDRIKDGIRNSEIVPGVVTKALDL
jgi:hypothetical protein